MPGERDHLMAARFAFAFACVGHVARMEDRIPKRLLFGWLPQRRPAHGT